MSRHGAIELDFGDGTHTFRLSLGGIEELEAKADMGLFHIATRLSPSVRLCHLKEISEVLRIGLIGGGMAPVEALAQVRRYVDERPIDENRDIAYAVCLAGLTRLHTKEVESPSGEPKAAKKRRASTSPKSQVQPS